VHNALTTTMRLQARCPLPHMGHLRQFRCKRFVLRTCWHHLVAQFPRWWWVWLTKHGQRGGNIGGVNDGQFAASMGTGESGGQIWQVHHRTDTRTWVLSVRGHKGGERLVVERGWRKSVVTQAQGGHRDGAGGVVATQQCWFVNTFYGAKNVMSPWF
jgi:hypothetical protein